MKSKTAVLYGLVVYPGLRLAGIRPKLTQMGTGAEPVRVVVLDAPYKRQKFVYKMLKRMSAMAREAGQFPELTGRRRDMWSRVYRHELRVDGDLKVRVNYR